VWVWGQVAHENRPCEHVGWSPLKRDHDEHVWEVDREKRPMWVWGQVAYENRPCECVGRSPLKIDDMIQARSNSDFDVKSAPIQFYGNNHNSQSDRWIKLKFYVQSPYMFSYLGFKFQVNRSSERHRNTGQQRMYEFCYLLPSDLWTSYLARILFLKGCGSLFWESPNSPKIFNGLQHSFHVWQGFINVQNPFLTRIPYSS